MAKKHKKSPKKVVKKVASGVKKVAVASAKTVATTTKKVKKQIVLKKYNFPVIFTTLPCPIYGGYFFSS